MENNNKKTNKQILLELEESIKFSNEIREKADSDMYIDNGSYEDYRDGFRFMSRVFVFFMSLSFILVLVSVFSLTNKDNPDVYATSRSGHIEEIINIKRR